MLAMKNTRFLSYNRCVVLPPQSGIIRSKLRCEASALSFLCCFTLRFGHKDQGLKMKAKAFRWKCRSGCVWWDAEV